MCRELLSSGHDKTANLTTLLNAEDLHKIKPVSISVGSGEIQVSFLGEELLVVDSYSMRIFFVSASPGSVFQSLVDDFVP